MIDNRGLTVLAQVTAEDFFDRWVVMSKQQDINFLANIIEGALQEAFKRGCEDCRLRVIDSDGEKS